MCRRQRSRPFYSSAGSDVYKKQVQDWGCLASTLSFPDSHISRSTCGLVAMTSASHAEGRQFDPGQVYFGASSLLFAFRITSERFLCQNSTVGSLQMQSRARHIRCDLNIGIVSDLHVRCECSTRATCDLMLASASVASDVMLMVNARIAADTILAQGLNPLRV